MNTKIKHPWVFELSQKRRNLNFTLLEEALDLISNENQRLFGEHIADALVRLKCDEETLCAALLYPSFKSQSINEEKIIKTFGKSIYKLLLGTKKIEAIDSLRVGKSESPSHNIDNLRKMLISMVDDIRTVLIKLAERLATLRELKKAEPVVQKRVADQVMQIYAPLANRLGIGQLKWRLEDLAFRYLEPELYRPIARHLKIGQEDREKFVENKIRQLESLLRKNVFEKFSVSGRAKHIYSIFQKTQRKNIHLSKLYDASAFRILVPNIQDCYKALSIIHSTWKPIPDEFDDYIANPKPNGYRSLHTAVADQNGLIFEIQIRTYDMHNSAELGVAAHWKYKEEQKHNRAYEEKINWLRKVLAWQQELSGDEENAQDLFQKMFADRIYVFTPAGDIFDLEKGSTPIDFAYHLHTDLGHRCRGAKVNRQLVPLSHTLSTGDTVEIISSKESKPSRDWLNPNFHYANSKIAQIKIRQWFNRIDRQNSEKWGLSFIEKEQTKIPKLKIGNIGKIERPEPTKAPSLDILGTSRLLTKIALCCHPSSQDLILGYITKNRGISIHKKSCANIQHSSQKHPERIIEIQWKNQPT